MIHKFSGPLSVIQVNQIAEAVNLHLIGRVIRVNGDDFFLRINSVCHHETSVRKMLLYSLPCQYALDKFTFFIEHAAALVSVHQHASVTQSRKKRRVKRLAKRRVPHVDI